MLWYGSSSCCAASSVTAVVDCAPLPLTGMASICTNGAVAPWPIFRGIFLKFNIVIFVNYENFRPPDIVCRRTYILPVFLLSFFIFVSHSLSLLNGTEPYSATWSEVSVILKCMSEIWGISLPPTHRGPKTHFFGRLRNLRAKLTAYIFRKKHDIDNPSSAFTTTRGLLRRPEMS